MKFKKTQPINQPRPKLKPMTQKQFAEILGMSESSVSRACKVLEDRGFIKREGGKLIPLTDAPDANVLLKPKKRGQQ